jgi:hypothetical protein
MNIPAVGYSDKYFSWFSATEYDDADKLDIIGFHSLTELGREFWLSVHCENFSTMNHSLKDFIERNDLSFNLKDTQSLKFQIVNLLVRIKGLALTPQDLEAWKDKVNLKTRDVIQAANKTEQWGLANFRPKKGSKTYYFVPQPFRVAKSYLVKQPIKDPNNQTEKENKVDAVKRWLRDTILSVPTKDWDIGHMDPENSANFVYQSRKYQRPLRNRFKFDEHGLARCPTIKELKANFNDYYSTQEEAEELYLYLKNKLKA